MGRRAVRPALAAMATEEIPNLVVGVGVGRGGSPELVAELADIATVGTVMRLVEDLEKASGPRPEDPAEARPVDPSRAPMTQARSSSMPPDVSPPYRRLDLWWTMPLRRPMLHQSCEGTCAVS